MCVSGGWCCRLGAIFISELYEVKALWAYKYMHTLISLNISFMRTTIKLTKDESKGHNYDSYQVSQGF